MTLVSILIPCRPGRPDLITSCLQSLVDKTKDKSRLEVCIKIDENDTLTREVVYRFKDRLEIKLFPMDGSRGIDDLAVYTNMLACHATGKLIWWWSDEVQVLNFGWDEFLAAYESFSDKFALFFPPWGNVFGDTYPMITRRWLSTTARFTGHPCLDTWVVSIADRIPGIVARAFLSGVQIKDTKFTRETTVESSSKLLVDFNSPEVQAELEKDIEKIKNVV